MPKAVISINFYGHNNPVISGVRYGYAPLKSGFFKATAGYFFGKDFNRVKEERLKDVKCPNGKLSVYDYNSGLSEADNKSITKNLLNQIKSEISDEMVFLITGYSAGGVTAVHMAQQIEQNSLNLFYIGLADAAFTRGSSDDLMTQHGLKGKYMKNYFQTLQNAPDVDEIHDEVNGFTNFNLNDQLVKGEDLHISACTIGNGKMLNDVKWCIGAI